MSTHRRKFLKQLGGLTLGTCIVPPLSLEAETIPTDFQKLLTSSNDDEQFWKFVRDQFPLKKSRTYFNNGTMGPSPYSVVETVKKGFLDVATDGEYHGQEIAREKLASFLNVKITELSLTHNTTEGINIVAWGMPLSKGDEVIMTTHEHVGNAAPWLNRARLHGIVIKTFTPALTAKENLERIQSLITKKTKVIAVPHIACTTGLVLPVKEISKLGKANNLYVFIDGAHGPGSTVLDLQDMGCDFYASCGHKWLQGPLGTGFLYVKEELLNVVQSYFVGGYAVTDTGWELSDKVQQLTAYAPTAHRYDYGSQSPSIYQGMAAAVDFINDIGAEKVANRGRALATHLQEGLLKLENKIEMLSATEPVSRGTIIGFKVKGIELTELDKKAAENNFRIRLVRESGLNSVRISTHIYNNFEDVDRFVEFIKKV